MNNARNCQDNDQMDPARFGYSQLTTDTADVVHLVYAPRDAVEPISVEISLDSTLSEAIEAIGPDGSLAWSIQVTANQ